MEKLKYKSGAEIKTDKYYKNYLLAVKHSKGDYVVSVLTKEQMRELISMLIKTISD